jgi:hypothetical protein
VPDRLGVVRDDHAADVNAGVGGAAGTVPPVSAMLYRTVHKGLLAAFPELREPYQRLFDDWDNFEGEPPGQYIVFSDTYGTMVEVALALPQRTVGREEVLRRATEFGETMLTASDAAVHDLGIDALAERLDNARGGPEVARQLGGSSLQTWFHAYSRSDWERPADDEIIDLWGVREAISHLLPDTPTHELPGISYPSASPDLRTLDAARAADDGAVLLAAYGTTHLLAVIRAGEVRADALTLDDLAVQLAHRLGDDLPAGSPSAKSPAARYRRIPRGERVWNMDRDGERHSRLWDEPWVADAFVAQRDLIASILRGDADLRALA